MISLYHKESVTGAIYLLAKLAELRLVISHFSINTTVTQQQGDYSVCDSCFLLFYILNENDFKFILVFYTFLVEISCSSCSRLSERVIT